MACDTRPVRREQTLAERVEEVRRKTNKLSEALATGRVKPVVGPQGAVTFVGWEGEERGGISDACALRRIMSAGGALARQKILAAEQAAGRKIDQRAVIGGTHSHDGGKTWHSGH